MERLPEGPSSGYNPRFMLTWVDFGWMTGPDREVRSFTFRDEIVA